MSIFARKEDGTLLLAHQDLEIQSVITDIHGTQAKVGVDAPLTVKAVRQGLLAQDDYPEP